MPSATKNLHTPIKVGDVELPNRFVMAPLTRRRAEPKTFVPTDLMVEYYSQRAEAGLIISEMTQVQEKAITFNGEGCLYNDAQELGWKKVVDAVHSKGGRIFAQLAHGGRAAHPDNNDGRTSVSASAIALTHTTQPEFVAGATEKQPNPAPRALTDAEVDEITETFRKSFLRAKNAGFDGVEIHSANGYLLNQFLNENSNKRTEGPYAGTSIKTRAKLTVDVVSAAVDVLGKGRVGVRLSPINSFQDMRDSDPVATVEYLMEEFNKLDIAYVHILRGDFFGIQKADVVTPARKFKNTLMVNAGYEAEEANAGIADGKFDVVAFGTKFIANPDLVTRVKKGAKINAADPKTFYTDGPVGYTDYKTLEQEQASSS